MKTIYKANGRTFKNMDEVREYADNNGFVVENYSQIIYRNTVIFAVNLKSK